MLTTCASIPCQSQDLASILSIFLKRFLITIQENAASSELKLHHQSDKFLQRLLKKEKRLKRKLTKVKSTASDTLFGSAEGLYPVFPGNMKQETTLAEKNAGQYFPHGNNIKTSLSFLERNCSLMCSTNGMIEQIRRSLTQLSTKLKLGRFIGYRLGENGIIGIGENYTGGQERYSEESFFLTGGFEQNYQPVPTPSSSGEAWRVLCGVQVAFSAFAKRSP